jgi:hypothetical protein
MPYKDKQKQADYHKAYYAENKQQIAKRKARWIAAKPEKQAQYTAAQNARYKANPDKYREYFRNNRIKKKYDLTEAQYAEWVVKQGGRCGICGKEPSGEWHGDRMLNVDHNHETGEVRGLLCNQCNRAIGLLGDPVEKMQAAVDYLARSK